MATTNFTRLFSNSGLNSAAMKPLFAIFCIFLLAGCSGSSLNPVNPPIASAATPHKFPYFTDGCGPGEAMEHAGTQIDLLDAPCGLEDVPDALRTTTQTLHSAGKEQHVAITTTADLHATTIQLWIGADNAALFETGVNLEILTPEGRYWLFNAEWDKHVEEHFASPVYHVNMLIPAGSKITLSRDPHGILDCKDLNVGCGTQERATIWGD